MSTASAARRTKNRPTPRLLTAADLAVMPADLPSGSVRYELDNGELIITPPGGETHGRSQLRLAAQLLFQGEERGLGQARVETGVILWRDPDRVVGPDALFVCNGSLPLRMSPEEYLETIPELVVEVRSKNDSLAEVLEKVKDYLKAGVRLVWVPDPQHRIVTAYRRGRKPKVFGEDDVLTAEDLIPGFQVTVRRLFQGTEA